MLRSLLLVAAVSVDGFAAAVGIGSAGIRIPFRSAAVISFTGTLFLGLSVGLAGAARLAVPETVCSVLSFALLMALGMFYLLRNIIKDVISGRHGKPEDPVMILFDGKAADMDNSKSISVREAAALSAALSADSAATGISAGLADTDLPLILAMTFAAGIASVLIGHRIGKTVSSAANADLSWLCGAVLIVLAFMNIS